MRCNMYTDFVNWYGTCAGAPRERAVATEHSEIYSIATVALPALQPQAAATMRCSTQADLVQMHDVGLLGTERGRDATEHSPLENTMETQQAQWQARWQAQFWRNNKDCQHVIQVLLSLQAKSDPPTFATASDPRTTIATTLHAKSRREAAQINC